MRMYHASDGQAHALSLYVSVIGEMVFFKTILAEPGEMSKRKEK
jgi:hypothetical protein